MARLTFRRPAAATRSSLDDDAAARSTALIDFDELGARLAETAAATGPGWFESTWDLWHGLEVREETTASVPACWYAIAAQRGGSASMRLACAV